MTFREEMQAMMNAARREGRRLAGMPLLAGEACPPAADWLVACYGARDETGHFDWLSAYLPYADANGVVLGAFTEKLPSLSVPVLADLCAADPFREHGQLLADVKARGFKGVCNYPSVGLMDGSFRTIVEQQKLGFDCEVRLIGEARHRGLYALALVFSPQEADAMLEAGADALLLHPGLAFIEAPVMPLSSYLAELASLSGRMPAECPLFACSIGPRHLEGVAHSLLNLGGFYATRAP